MAEHDAIIGGTLFFSNIGAVNRAKTVTANASRVGGHPTGRLG